MTSNPLLIEMIAKERKQFFEQEAREIQIASKIENNNNTFTTKAIERFANLLISFGEYLKKKYSPEVILELSEDTCTSNC